VRPGGDLVAEGRLVVARLSVLDPGEEAGVDRLERDGDAVLPPDRRGDVVPRDDFLGIEKVWIVQAVEVGNHMSTPAMGDGFSPTTCRRSAVAEPSKQGVAVVASGSSRSCVVVVALFGRSVVVVTGGDASEAWLAPSEAGCSDVAVAPADPSARLASSRPASLSTIRPSSAVSSS